MSDITMGNTTELMKGFTSWFAFVPMSVWIAIVVILVGAAFWFGRHR